MTFKPMLAGKCSDVKRLRFPVVASPKLDGIRATVQGGVVMSRSLKPIPNRHVQALFSQCEGFDGELIAGDPTAPNVFRATTSAVMTEEGTPDVNFWVFDSFREPNVPWWLRLPTLSDHPKVVIVDQIKCHTVDELDAVESRCLSLGYEGVMLRDPNGPYKQGRSTEREGILLKLKRFEDSEALVLGMVEKMHNGNEAKTNALGHTERSGHQANLLPMNTMGALLVKDLNTGIEFSIGSGFDDDERARWWAMKNNGRGRIIKYQHFPSGVKDKPRFPTYLGERNPMDMSW